MVTVGKCLLVTVTYKGGKKKEKKRKARVLLHSSSKKRMRTLVDFKTKYDDVCFVFKYLPVVVLHSM